MSVATLPAFDALHAPHLRRHMSPEQLSDEPLAQRSERPLPIPPPSVPPSIPRRSSLRGPPSIPNLSEKAAGKARAQLPAYVSPREALSTVLREPRVLDCLLAMLPWRVFYSLACTCREFRNVLTNVELRNVVLSHYLPGFRACLAHASEERVAAVDLSDMHDLVLFQLSQHTPLHRYPMHALSIVSSSLFVPDIPPNDPRTLRYRALTQAHTRFVLLLQSLVHSGFSFVSDVDADDFTSLPSVGTPGQALAGLRELVFPKPLSFFEKAGPTEDQPNQKVAALSLRKSLKRGSSGLDTYTTYKPPRASSDFQPTVSRKPSKRNPLKPIASALGIGQRIPLPPPSSNPPALSYYASGWRRTLVSRHHPRHASEGSVIPRSRSSSVPRRPILANRSTSSSFESSSPSSSSSNSNIVEINVANIRQPSFPLNSPIPRFSSSSPHDFGVATSRFRAPILRVFAPCTQLDEVAVHACEQQLADEGLWKHLSEGDIVCNLGFVPSPEPDDSSLSSGSCGTQDREARPGYRRRWLIFNGYCLVHFIPPSPPPVHNALTLPTPFYYSHILPPYSNARYILALPPLSSGSDGAPQRALSPPESGSPRAGDREREPFASMTLTSERTKVSSPHSPAGYAVVKKYTWVARIPYVGPGSGTEAGIALGEGWQGEWILEAEGTQEGKQQLLDAVKADPSTNSTRRGVWEIVRDKSGAGRIWFRLIAPSIETQEPRNIDI